MAKVKGMIDAGEVMLDLTSTYSRTLYMYFVHRVPWAHEEWQTDDDNKNLLRHKIDREVTLVDTNEPEISDLTIDWYCAEAGSESFTTDDDPDVTTSWEGPDTDTLYPKGIIFNNSPGDESDKFRYQICEMEIDVVGGANVTAEIQAVWVELIHDDTTPGYDVEYLKRSAATRLYGPDYFITAWHVMNVLAESNNRLQYEARARYCLPLCGYGIIPTA